MSDKKTVLVADDEPEVVKQLIDRLRHEGYRTIAAFEGIRATEMAHKEKPDLILLDLRMPVGSGEKVLTNLRNDPDTMDIPIIVLSALPKQEHEIDIHQAGAQAFFQKPFDFKMLLSKMDELLS